MARKKKARFTSKKKSDKSKRKTPGGLSPHTFASLPHEYGSFTVEDSDHEQHTFVVGEIAYVQHRDLDDDASTVPEEDYWICQIKEIRGNSPADVWVCVEWFWAPEEVAEVIKTFDPSLCGKYEKLFSDNTDIISVHCFVSLVEVKVFDETCIYQESIGPDEWYFRYTFLYDLKRISPKVIHTACTICKIPYTPGEEKILHFCPRQHCRSFYHQSCLLKANYVEKTPKHRLLETWPDLDRTELVEDLGNNYCPLKRRKKEHNETRKSLTNPLAELPEKLVAIANQPIVRGTLGGGVVGNITAVSAARQLIYKILTGASVVPDNWETMIDVAAASPGMDNFPNCICPNCLSPI